MTALATLIQLVRFFGFFSSMLSRVLNIDTESLYASVPAPDGEKWVSGRGKKRMSPALPNLLCSPPQQKATRFLYRTTGRRECCMRVLVREVAKEEKEISVVGLVTKPSFLSNPA
jgi:hypothetical protein